MTITRGRFGHYKLLKNTKRLSPHVPDIHVYSESVLTSLLNNLQPLFIRPLLGPELIRIIKSGETYNLVVNDNEPIVTDRKSIVPCLIKQLHPKKTYIIQVNPTISYTPCRTFYTLQRKREGANWKTVHKTVQDTECTPRYMNFLIHWKLNRFLLAVAGKLGDAFVGCHTMVLEIGYAEGAFFLYDTILHERNSKWSQYQSFIRSRTIRPFMPHTDLCTKSTLKAFLRNYGKAIIKPAVGQQGKGIVKITIMPSGDFEVQKRNNLSTYKTFDALFQSIHALHLSREDYIIQYYIALGIVDGCPFDVRVITQFDEEYGWIATGKLVKVAAPGYFITNRAQKLLAVEEVLSVPDSHIEQVCINGSIALSAQLNNLSIIGFDIGVEEGGKVWVIEANHVPSIAMFHNFGNNEMHTKITQFIGKRRRSLSENRKEEG